MSQESEHKVIESTREVIESTREVTDRTSIVYDESQLAAIDLCASRERVVAVSGSAGTGKTTIMREVYERLTAAGYNCALCAPTGKAARRISQSTGLAASTIHRLLEFPRPGEIDQKTGKPKMPGVPQRHRRNPLEYDCVLIDEAPMASTTLMRYIYEALPAGGLVRLFGDMNQLPPVEDEKRVAPFWEILNRTRLLPDGTKRSLGVVLTNIYRQKERSGILDNATRVISQQYPKSAEDFKLYPTKDIISTLKRIAGKHFATLQSQVICPIRSFTMGTNTINEVLRMHYNPTAAKSLVLPRHSWHAKLSPYRVSVGDKVIMTKNWYELGTAGIMNGDTGIVVDITKENDLIIEFETETAAVPASFWSEASRALVQPQKDIELAYAVTTHKAQGSEYDEVIYVISTRNPMLVHKNNFYTGITRARNFVAVVYLPNAMSAALKEYRRI